MEPEPSGITVARPFLAILIEETSAQRVLRRGSFPKVPV
jgi:hypothetical protein